jgi:hypothetical protein
MLRLTQARDGFDQAVMGAVQQADTIYAVVLAANTCQRIAIPSGTAAILFAVSGGTDFFLKLVDADIAVPTVNAVDGTAPELNPLLRTCAGKTHVSLVSGSACTITMSFYN